MASQSTKRVTAFVIIALLVGIVIGYLGATAVAPSVPPTGAKETATMTVTTTMAGTVVPSAGPVEYTIGIVADLSGGGESFAIETRDSALIAVDEVNAMLQGAGIPVRFKTIVEDSKTTVEGAVAAVQSLAAAGVKVIMGHLWSGQLNGIKSFVDSNKIVVVSASSTSPLVAADDYMFRMQASDAFQGQALSSLLWADGFRKIAVINRNDPYGQGIGNVFKKEFEALGGTVRILSYTPDQADYASEVAALASTIRELGADSTTAVLIVGFEAEALNIFGHARLDATLPKVKWFSSEGIRGSKLLPPESPTEIGDFLTTVGLTGTFPASPVKTPLMDDLSNKLGHVPNVYGAQAYDGTWLLALSILTAGRYDGEAVRKVLPGVAAHMIGASGHLMLEENGDRASQDYDIWNVKKSSGTKFEYVVIGKWSSVTRQVTFSA